LVTACGTTSAKIFPSSARVALPLPSRSDGAVGIAADPLAVTGQSPSVTSVTFALRVLHLAPYVMNVYAADKLYIGSPGLFETLPDGSGIYQAALYSVNDTTSTA
jgi:hypothetical protein